ncbi:MAG: hypothetical protein C0180_06885 [Aciduliprofundum sp.]|nr:MAG: hypothetical protein C0180_06885 [Aciduliprofundum sp.]
MRSILIFGVGNRILGDDGAGSIAAERLSHLSGEGIEIIDAGTSLYYYLWPLVYEERLPDEIIIMDIMVGEKPGTLHLLDFPQMGKGFLSTHLFPDTDLFRRISGRNVSIKFLLCEVGEYEKIFTENLSENGRCCVEKMVDFIENYIKKIK